MGSFGQSDSNSGSGNFGSMQIHLPGQTVFAFNRFNDGSVADLGIGNSNIGLGSDWSMASNADSYQVRTLKVFTNAQAPATTSTSSTTTSSTTTTSTTTIQTSSPTNKPTITPLTPPPVTAQPTNEPTPKVSYMIPLLSLVM